MNDLIAVDGRFPPRLLLWIVLTLLLAGLTACGLIGDTPPAVQYGDQVALSGQAVVICSQECADRRQCGTTPEQTQVVLMRTDRPAVKSHDRVMASLTAVAIGELRQEQVVQLADNVPFVLNFYFVTDPIGLESGWVAGWCVASRAP